MTLHFLLFGEILYTEQNDFDANLTDIQVNSDKWSALATTPALIEDPPFYQICLLSTAMKTPRLCNLGSLKLACQNSLSPAIRNMKIGTTRTDTPLR